MADLLPLFPLNSVLYPGIPLPLHVFEERYRVLMNELMVSPLPRRFGVVAIRHGLEAGEDDVELYDVGCVAELRRVVPRRDGRLDIVTTGGPRFRLLETDDSRPYLLGSVEYLAEPSGDDAEVVTAVVRAFTAYWDAVAAIRGEDEEAPELPRDPALLSWVVAASVHVDLPEKQALLEVPDTSTRLRRELSILRRETMLVRQALTRPSAPPAEGPFSLN